MENREGAFTLHGIESRIESNPSWSNGVLEEYLKLLGRKPEARLGFNNFPEEISLSEALDQELNELRNTLPTKLENYKGVGYSLKKNTLLIPKAPSVGTETKIGKDVIRQQWEKAQQNGASRHLGSIHTHPREVHELSQPEAFSSHDLYGLTILEDVFLGVVGQYENIFAFASRESARNRIDPMLLSGESFSHYWRAQLEMANSPRYTSGISLNIAIADYHKLVLYAGDAGQPLSRFYPKP